LGWGTGVGTERAWGRRPEEAVLEEVVVGRR
jgi:hypothetical protein